MTRYTIVLFSQFGQKLWNVVVDLFMRTQKPDCFQIELR